MNAGVAIGLFPTTGLPMPFISYGGTAMIINSVVVGILLNVSKQIPMEVRAESAEANAKACRKSKPLNDDPVVGRVYS